MHNSRQKCLILYGCFFMVLLILGGCKDLFHPDGSTESTKQDDSNKILTAPTGLKAEAKSDGTIYLTWNSVSGASGYNIQYSEWSASGPYNMLAEAPAVSNPSYTDSSIQSGQSRYYQVKAFNSSGESPASSFEFATASGSDKHEVPDSPTITSVTVSPSSTTVNKGETLQFNATVNGTNNPSQSVTWTVSGGTSAYTYMLYTGTEQLYVGYDETASTLIVTATATGTNIVGTATVTIGTTQTPQTPSNDQGTIRIVNNSSGWNITYWEVKNSSGTIVESSDVTISKNGGQKDVVVEPGSYTVKVRDSYSDSYTSSLFTVSAKQIKFATYNGSSLVVN